MRFQEKSFLFLLSPSTSLLFRGVFMTFISSRYGFFCFSLVPFVLDQLGVVPFFFLN